MANAVDELTRALTAIAADDADDAHRVLPAVESRLMSEFRAAHAAHPRRLSRGIGLAIAALLTVALAAPLWMVGRGVPLRPPSASRSNAVATKTEIATAFMPLPYHAIPMTEGHLVRLEVPRSALVAFGLASDDMQDVRQDPVLADVVVGEDGLARAVRFVRASRAPGVTP
jgi:hypothetical protein